MKRSRIVAVAHHFPDQSLSSTELEQMIASQGNYSPTTNIIESITGIQTRHVSAPDEYNSSMAIAATEKLFSSHQNIAKDDVDLLLFASAGQDLIEPATAHIVQKAIGTHAPVLDVTNACNSFINALEIADAFIRNGSYKNILIATGEVSTKSAKLAVKDRNDFKQSFPGYTFGDAGTAALISASDDASGVIDLSFTAQSEYWDSAILAGGGSRFLNAAEQYFMGSGHELKTAFDTIGPEFIKTFLTKHSLKPADITHVFAHQVSVPYLESFVGSCGFSPTQIEETVSYCGNVAAATLPLAWSLRAKRGELKDGDTVLLVGLAGGISLGAALIRI